MFERFITRPVLATVISVILVILGVVGMTQLPITRFPDIAPPSVTVTASYPGASAETVGRSVAPPLEEAINGVENMIYMTSTSANDGSLSINVFSSRAPMPTRLPSMCRTALHRQPAVFQPRSTKSAYRPSSARTA